MSDGDGDDITPENLHEAQQEIAINAAILAIYPPLAGNVLVGTADHMKIRSYARAVARQAFQTLQDIKERKPIEGSHPVIEAFLHRNIEDLKALQWEQHDPPELRADKIRIIRNLLKDALEL
jgi:hypothetical protein